MCNLSSASAGLVPSTVRDFLAVVGTSRVSLRRGAGKGSVYSLLPMCCAGGILAVLLWCDIRSPYKPALVLHNCCCASPTATAASP